MNKSGWVRARAKCTIEGNFDVLSRSIQKDIQAFNGLASSEDGTRKRSHVTS